MSCQVRFLIIGLLSSVWAAYAQPGSVGLFSITNAWRYQQTTNFDGVSWMAPTFDDSTWPSGRALLYVETSPSVTPRNTSLTLGRNTYYFRTHFQFTNGASGASLVFSNLIDDGAILYLNGTEVQRVRMPAAPAPITNATFATATPPPIGDAWNYDVFTLTGDILTNLLNGDNVLAVEVHQRTAADDDIVWGAALRALPYTGAMTFVTQPTSVSVLDGRPAAFSAKAIADPDPVYQWFRDGVPITGATNRTLSMAAAYPSHDGIYSLQASNANGTVTSSNAILAVIGDYHPPVPLSATGGKDLVTVSIPFTEAPYPPSATDVNHFVVIPDGPGSASVQILSAMLTNQTNVVLTTTPRTPRSDYVVLVEGVHDISSRSNTLAVDLPLLSTVDLVMIDATTIWRFDDSGAEPPANWAQSGFDDSGWSNGPAVFYAGTQAGLIPATVRTALALTNRFDGNRVLSYFFRLPWGFPGDPVSASLRLRHMVDDGAAFYLNGTEVANVRLPATRPLYATNLATTSINTAAYEPATNQPGIIIPTSGIRLGSNTLAVEVHQGATNSSDLAFAATLEATIERFVPPVRLQVPATLSEIAGIVTNAGMAGIDAPLPTNLVVTLASSDSSSLLVPAAVVIAAGVTNTPFDISINNDGLLNGARPIVVSARAPGSSTGRATVSLLDDEVATLSLALPSVLTEGASAPGTLTLNVAPTYAASVTLVATNPALTVPTNVVVPPGSTSVVFNLSATEDTILNGARASTVIAQIQNWVSATGSVTIADNEFTNVVLALPAAFTEADGVRANAGRVSLFGIPLSNVVVTLQSSSPGELSVPSSVTVMAGQTNAFFDVTVFNDVNTNGTRSIFVSAGAPGFAAAQASAVLHDDDPAIISFSHVASPQYAGRAFALVLDAYDVTGRLLTNFAGTFGFSATSPTGPMSVLPVSTGPFTNGRWSGAVTIPSSARFVRLSCPPLNSTSDPFHVEVWPMRTNYFPAQNIVHSPLTRLIYGSVPSYAATNPNTVTAFDPVGGTNVWSLPVGDIIRPGFDVDYRSGTLALADSGQYLFVVASNASVIRRLDVQSRTITASFSPVGVSVASLAPVAGSSTALAVSLAHNPLEPKALFGVAVYDNGVQRPNIAAYGANLLKPGLDATKLYGIRRQSGGFARLSVTGTGATLLDSTNGLFPDTYNGIAHAGGLVYAAAGQVVDPTNLVLLAMLQPSGGRIEPDTVSGRIFIAGYTGTNYFIQAHDARTFLPLKRILLPAGAGEIINLVRYGTNGLAMHTYWDFLYLVESTLLLPSGTIADLRLSQTHAPEPPLAGSDLTFTVSVTNAGPEDAFEATITDTLPTNAVFIAASVSQGFWTNESGTVRAELGYFPVGSTATLMLTVRPTMAAPIANRAFVIANESDTNLLDNVATNSAYVRISLALDSSAAISLTTRDIVYDPVTDRIYASVPQFVPGIGDQLVPVDPATGVVEVGWDAGKEPGRLVLIPPGGRIYAAVNTNYAVSRINLASRTAELTFALNSNAPPAEYTVEDFAVLPGTPDALAVLRLGYGFNSEIGAYDNGVPRSNVAAASGDYYLEHLTAGADGTAVYFQSWGVGGFRRLDVDSQGVTTRYVSSSITAAFWSRKWMAVGSLLFGSDGVVIDPLTPRIVATVPVQGTLGNSISCYDDNRGRVFYLVFSNAWSLGAFDSRTLAPLQSLTISNVNGAPSSLMRVRDNGFAFRTDAGQLFVLRATAAGYGMASDLAVNSKTSAPRVSIGSNFTISVTATNGGPGSASNIVASLLLPPSVAIVTTSIPHTAYWADRVGMKFNLGALASGASTNITITLRATGAGVSRFIAAVTGNAEDARQTNNVAIVEVLTVFPPAWTGVNSVPLPARDLAYDQGRKVLYVSSGAETVSVVSPETGEVLGSIFAGPFARRLKITDNGEFLYVTVSNDAAIARIRLSDGVRDLLFDLGLNLVGNPYLVTDFEPISGGAHSVVAGKRHPSHAYGAVTIYDDGVPRSLSLEDDSGADHLEFANSPDRAFASGRGGAFRRFRKLEINSNGIQELTAPQDIPPALLDFEHGGGLFYATTGDILAPATSAVIAHINGLGPGTLVEPDGGQNHVFFLTPIVGSEWRLQAFEFGGLSPIGSLSVSNVIGSPVTLVRWGTNRFAFNTTSNVLYFVKMDAGIQFTSRLSNTVALANQPVALQWQLNNTGPASVVVTVSNRMPGFASFAGGSASSGSLLGTNGSVLWSLTNLANSTTSTADVRLLFTNSTDLLITNQSVSFAALPSPQSTSNAVTLVFRVLADDDSDGLGDTWELHNFGGLGVTLGADADGDGHSNQQEFTNGTDPRDSSNVLRIIQPTLVDNVISITFFAMRGHDYAVEKAASVSGPWTEVFIVSGESERITWTETLNASPAFYRVHTEF